MVKFINSMQKYEFRNKNFYLHTENEIKKKYIEKIIG